jgi:peptide deformylase
MVLFEILTYPNPFLHREAAAVEAIDDGIHDIIDKMAATLYDAPGVGLAAIQVGIDKSILVYDASGPDEDPSLQVLINPSIVHNEGDVLSENEGCLSVIEFRSDVKRSSRVCVEGLDREGNPVSIDDDGHLAIVLQHEIDHLNGILFIDRISALKRQMYKRRVKKQLRTK